MVTAMAIPNHIFGILWSTPEHSPDPVTARITKGVPLPAYFQALRQVDDQAALGQTGKRPPRSSMLGLADEDVAVDRLELVGGSGGV
jgi:hypothetical protein